MTHNRTDITDVHIGQAGSIDLTVEDSDGTAVSMTGGAATFAILDLSDREQALANADVHVEKTIADGGITEVDAANGELRVDLDPADTEELTPRTYWYRVNIEDSDGDPVPGAVAGEFELIRD